MCSGCTGINIGEVFLSPDFRETRPYFWVDLHLTILFIFIFLCNKNYYRNYYFLFIF